MAFCLIKISVLLSFLCYIKLNNSHEGLKVPHKCFMIDGNIKLHHKKINSPFYYNPVDTIWKREKCHSLGFKYKEVNTKVMFTSYILPVELYYTDKSLPIILSELICGDRILRKRFARNIVNNLISNEDIKQLFETEEMYNEYKAKYVKLNTPAQPIYNDEVCPICYDKISISCVLNNCKHQLCGTCTDKLLIKKRKSCPLCRASFITFLENGENMKSLWGELDILASAYYLNVCIYVYNVRKKVWIFYHNSLNTADMKNEKCIYLYLTKNRMNVVTNLTPP